MSIKNGKIDSFEGYSQFKVLKEFNNHFEMWMADKKRYFTRGELIGLQKFQVSPMQGSEPC